MRANEDFQAAEWRDVTYRLIGRIFGHVPDFLRRMPESPDSNWPADKELPMRPFIVPVTMVFGAALAARAAEPQPSVRSFTATYVATVQEVPAGLSRLEVWFPLPQDSADQTITNVQVDSPYPGAIRSEKESGNAYYYFSTDSPKAGPLEIRVRFEAERREAGAGGVAAAASPSELERSLRAEGLVTLSPRIREI